MNPFLLPIVALGGLGLFFLSRQQKGTDLSKYSRAMVVGDSHSEADWTFGGRMGQFLKGRGIQTKVVGNRGWSVSRYLQTGRLDEELRQSRPQLLLVALGANDQVSPSQVTDYQDKLRRFLQKARSWEVKEVVWFGPSKSEGSQAHRMPTRTLVASAQRALMSHHGVPGLKVTWIDSLGPTSDLPTRDGVHMARREYGIWANRAQQLLT